MGAGGRGGSGRRGLEVKEGGKGRGGGGEVRRGGSEGGGGRRGLEAKEGRGGEVRRGGREGGARAKSPIRPPTLRNITSSNVER